MFGYPVFQLTVSVDGVEVAKTKAGITAACQWVHDRMAERSEEKMTIEIRPLTEADLKEV